MTNYLRKMLNAAADQGFEFICSYDGEVDYQGYHPAAAEEALRACDEMRITLRDDGRVIGSALIIPGLAPDEQIADYGGAWIDAWWNRNIGSGA